MTPRVLEACAAFGLLPARAGDEAARRESLARAAAARIDRDLAPGGVCVVTGPSGAGKSMTLRALRERLARVARIDVRPPPRTRAVIDAVPGSVAGALRALAAAGLSEAPLLARRASELSGGQRARLALARAFAQARPCATLLVDELGSGLDAASRRSLAATVSRWARVSRVRVVAATVHDGVARGLHPDLLLRVAPNGTADTSQPPRRARPRITIEPGRVADYDRLGAHHYRAGRPATVCRVLRARHGADVVGVLVVSMPTLEGWWRDLAWPRRFRTGAPARDAARLNRQVRCISRVIVDPRWRGLGIATRLVRAYLRQPLTSLTESCAAMGAWCPVFASAGMTEYRSPPGGREARLADALTACGRDAHALLHSATWPPLVRREMRRWTGASRTTRTLPDDRAGEAAWRALSSSRIAYAAHRKGK